MEFKINIEDKTFLRNVSGMAVNIDWTKVHPNVIPSILTTGATTILNNTFNGGGKNADDKERMEKVKAKLAAWEAGDFNVASRGGSGVWGKAKDAYVLKVQAAHPGTTQAQVVAKMKALVKEVFGDKETASMENFVNALAAQAIPGKGDKVAERREAEALRIRDSLVDYMAKIEAERAEAQKGLDLSDIDI